MCLECGTIGSMGRITASATIKLAIGAGIGFGLFWISSHPKSKLHNRLPKWKIRNFEFLPNVKIVGKEKSYHLHHWAILGLLYYRYFLQQKKFQSKLLHGFMLGSILQGLTYKDRFKFSYTHATSHNKNELLLSNVQKDRRIAKKY